MGKHYAQSIAQEISIANGCDNVATIVHEMMHAIGNLSLAFLCDGKKITVCPRRMFSLGVRSLHARLQCDLQDMVFGVVASFSTNCRLGWLSFPPILKIVRMASTQ